MNETLSLLKKILYSSNELDKESIDSFLTVLGSASHEYIETIYSLVEKDRFLGDFFVKNFIQKRSAFNDKNMELLDRILSDEMFYVSNIR